MTPIRIAAALLLSLSSAGAATQAAAQNPICGKRDSLVAQLERKYGEARQAVGLQGDNVIVEVYASPDTGTWTILFTRPNGVACAMAAGEAWSAETGVARRGAPT
jgi:hypothetical protein